jgi:hypothetical protein
MRRFLNFGAGKPALTGQGYPDWLVGGFEYEGRERAL